MSTPTVSRTLTAEETAAFGRELDALREEVRSDLGARDVAHIRKVIRTTRQAEAGGRVLLALGLDPLSFAAGVAALSTSKILSLIHI